MKILSELNKTNKKLQDEAMKLMDKWEKETKTEEKIFSDTTMPIYWNGNQYRLQMKAGDCRLIDTNCQEQFHILSLSPKDIKRFILDYRDKMVSEIADKITDNLSESNKALLKIVKEESE